MSPAAVNLKQLADETATKIVEEMRKPSAGQMTYDQMRRIIIYNALAQAFEMGRKSKD